MEATPGSLFEYCSCIPSIPSPQQCMFLVHYKDIFSNFANECVKCHAFSASFIVWNSYLCSSMLLVVRPKTVVMCWQCRPWRMATIESHSVQFHKVTAFIYFSWRISLCVDESNEHAVEASGHCGKNKSWWLELKWAMPETKMELAFKSFQLRIIAS